MVGWVRFAEGVGHGVMRAFRRAKAFAVNAAGRVARFFTDE